MKFFILCAIIATASAAGLIASPYALETGASAQYRNQDAIGNYNFGYNEDHTTGGTFRRESGDAWGNKVGSYGLRDADGRHRVVNYVADAAGFRANIQTNEPGTEPKDPAATLINKGVAVAAAAPVFAHAVAPAVAHHAAVVPAVAHHAAVVPAVAHHAAVVPAVAHHAAVAPAVAHHAAVVPAVAHHAAVVPAVAHHAAVTYGAAPVLAHGALYSGALGHHGLYTHHAPAAHYSYGHHW